MAIAFDSASDGANSTSFSSVGASYTHTAVASCIGFIALAFDDQDNHNPSCTIGGVAATRIVNSDDQEELGNEIAVFRGAMSAGGNAVVLTWTTGVAYAVCSSAYTVLDSGTPSDTPAVSGDTLNTISREVTSAVGALVLGCVAMNSPTDSNPTATGTGHTNRALATNAQIAARISDLTGASPTATLTYTCDFDRWVVAGINMNAGVAAGLEIPIAMHHYKRMKA